MRRSRSAATVLCGFAILFAGLSGPGSQAQDGPPIQPGSPIISDDSACTLNWVYDEVVDPADYPESQAPEPRVFVGTAAHCVKGVGREVHLTTQTLGTAILRIGKVALTGGVIDFALIEVDQALHHLVVASLKGHPAIPTGVSYSTNTGDLIQFSGNGVGFHATQPTREERRGVLSSNDLCQHYVYGVVTPADSGGPVANISDGGKALGLVSTITAGVKFPDGFVGVAEGGVSLPCVFDIAEAGGIKIRLRTV